MSISKEELLQLIAHTAKANHDTFTDPVLEESLNTDYDTWDDEYLELNIEVL